MPNTTKSPGSIKLDDIIDVRDIIARVEWLEDELNTINDRNDSEFELSREELTTLAALMSELKGNGGDEQWRGDWYPVTLIRASEFRDYAEQLAVDTCDMGKATDWPFRHIDWDAAAHELKIDYSTVDFDGVEYYYR